MRWSGLAFLAVGLVAGLAIGLAVAPERSPMQADRTAPAVEREVARPRPPPPAPPPVVAPGGDIPREEEEEAELGRVEVDFRSQGGEPEAWVEGADLRGRPKVEFFCGTTEEPVARIALAAGEYRVWWRDPVGLERRGALVRVEAGRVTALSADGGAPLPAGSGLGRLEVVVEAAEGGVRPRVEVTASGWVLGDFDDLSERTNADGSCRFEMRPGRYEVRVGDRAEVARVREGETTEVRLRHVAEGDLILRGPVDFRWDLRDLGTDEGHYMAFWNDGGRSARLFLAAGDYEVWARLDPYGGDDRLLGVATVAAGEATYFDPSLPPARLQVIVKPDAVGSHTVKPVIEVAAAVEGLKPERLKRPAQRAPRMSAKPEPGVAPVLHWTAIFDHVAAGPFRVRAYAPGWLPAEERVEVRDEPLEVTLTLERDPAAK